MLIWKVTLSMSFTINMSLEKGTLTGFIGPNGTGKTTTIKCILNMVQPDKGKITILDTDSVSNNLEIKSKLGTQTSHTIWYVEP